MTTITFELWVHCGNILIVYSGTEYKLRNYITLDSVINDYIDESEQSVHKYAKLYNIAVRGMEKLGLDFFYKIRTVKVPVDTTNYTAQLPNDYISYTKIGVLNSVGEIIPLKFNSKMTF